MADDGRIDNGRINGVEVNHNMFARSGSGFENKEAGPE